MKAENTIIRYKKCWDCLYRGKIGKDSNIVKKTLEGYPTMFF